MKKFRFILWSFTGVLLIGFVFLFGQNLWIQFQSNHQAGRFLKDFTDRNFEDAFNRLYFYDKAFDEDVSIPEVMAKKSWISRNIQLTKAGTYIKSYDGLEIQVDDGWPMGTVNLVMVENGKETVYKNVHISFTKADGRWKIGKLQTMKDKDWEETFSGHILQ
jgi:hypothetical protein